MKAPEDMTPDELRAFVQAALVEARAAWSEAKDLRMWRESFERVGPFDNLRLRG